MKPVLVPNVASFGPVVVDVDGRADTARRGATDV
jgi:hypothetical protein